MTQAPAPAADPCCFVIFGASGDLNEPLAPAGALQSGRHGLAAEALCHRRRGAQRSTRRLSSVRTCSMPCRRMQPGPWIHRLAQRLVAHVAYLSGSIDDAETFSKLEATLEEIERRCRHTGQSAVLPGHATGHVRAHRAPVGSGWPVSGGSLRRPVAPGGR